LPNVATTKHRRVAVLGGDRIPFARSDGAYAQASNQDMFTAVLTGLADRFGLDGARLDAVIGGAVLKHSRDFNLIRECVLGSPLSPDTPAFDLQQACGTGLQATIAAADGIAAGRYEVAAAGGVDTTSDAPIGLGDNLRRSLLAVRRSRSTLDRIKLAGRVPAALGVEIPTNGEPRTGLSMGEHAAITAKQMGIKRSDQDELAAASHRNAAAAYDRGFFDDLVTGFLGLYRDDGNVCHPIAMQSLYYTTEQSAAANADDDCVRLYSCLGYFIYDSSVPSPYSWVIKRRNKCITRSYHGERKLISFLPGCPVDYYFGFFLATNRFCALGRGVRYNDYYGDVQHSTGICNGDAGVASR
jgi:hypothetical protein